MADTPTSPPLINRLPTLSDEETERVVHLTTMKSLLEVIKPHLEEGKTKLVYIFPATRMIGHIIGETFALWSLYHDSYDDILVVIEDRTTCPMPEGPMRVAERYVTFVETNDEDVKLLGHFDGPLSKFGPFDLLIQTPQSLSHDFFPLVKPDGFQRHFELPPEFLEHGQAFLDGLGWRPGEPIVVLHVREGNFRENLQYHAHRTADIANYLPTIDFLASQGYWVFKIGDNGSNPLTHSNPRVIDLPHLRRYANWMDLFLVARSEFSINCSSGPVSYCHALGTHSLVVNNLVQSFNLFVPTGRFVLMFKTYRDAASGRQLSYAEILERDLSDFSEQHKYEEAGVSIEENTADEILEATKEMRARLAGNHQEDEALQSRFRHLGQAYDANRIRRVDEGTAAPAMQLSPHYCFGFPFMNIVEAYCRRHPDFLGTEGGTEPNIDTMSR